MQANHVISMSPWRHHCVIVNGDAIAHVHTNQQVYINYTVEQQEKYVDRTEQYYMYIRQQKKVPILHVRLH